MPYQTKTAKNVSIPVGLTLGWLAGVLVTLATAVVVTSLIAGERTGEGVANTAAVAAMLLASFVGAMVTGGKIGNRRLVMCLASGGLYFVTLLCCNALFFDGSYQGLLAAALTILGSSLVAGLMGIRQKRQKKPHAKVKLRR